MGSKEIIPTNKITERMLPPHLRRLKTKTSSILIQNTFNEDDYDSLTAGESIAKGNAVHVASDGLAYKADNTSNKPAVGFAVDDASQNETVYILTSRRVTVSSASFVTGGRVFLSSGAINISTTVPTLSNNDILQRLGTAVSSDIIQIEIEEVRIAQL